MLVTHFNTVIWSKCSEWTPATAHGPPRTTPLLFQLPFALQQLGTDGSFPLVLWESGVSCLVFPLLYVAVVKARPKPRNCQ